MFKLLQSLLDKGDAQRSFTPETPRYLCCMEPIFERNFICVVQNIFAIEGLMIATAPTAPMMRLKLKMNSKLDHTKSSNRVVNRKRTLENVCSVIGLFQVDMISFAFPQVIPRKYHDVTGWFKTLLTKATPTYTCVIPCAGHFDLRPVWAENILGRLNYKIGFNEPTSKKRIGSIPQMIDTRMRTWTRSNKSMAQMVVISAPW